MKKTLTFFFLTVMMLFSVSFSFGLSSGAEEGVIPFRKLAHLMTVTVKINDSPKQFNFVVDTGGATFVSKQVADDLGLKQVGPQAKINTLRMEGFQIENIFCFTSFDFSMFNPLSVPIHGIIGSTLLERYRVMFDYKADTMTLSAGVGAQERPEDAIVLKFTNHPVNNAPIVEFKINGKTMEGMIDTGQPHAVVLPIDTFEKYSDTDVCYCFSGLCREFLFPKCQA